MSTKLYTYTIHTLTTLGSFYLLLKGEVMAGAVLAVLTTSCLGILMSQVKLEHAKKAGNQ